ncbi:MULTISPECIES: DUF551 domain-containing protein [unclassified Candidatus Paralachnospira]|uniref:DUF551 domain-containing protein n=1 Tax=unclassified Candidatus Paralachnospira TaxID=3099471 RepID=UPI003F9342A8
MKSVRIELKRSCLECDYCELEIEKVCGLITACQVLRCGHANVCKGYIDDQDPTISDCLEEKKEWILTGERLPEDDTLVLVQITGQTATTGLQNAMQIGYYDLNWRRWYIDGYEDFVGEVIAWQPLPEPYKEGQSWTD